MLAARDAIDLPTARIKDLYLEITENVTAPLVVRNLRLSWPVAAREALVARGDDLAVQALLSGIGYAVVGAVLALNRVYLPHTRLKWQRHLIAGLEVAPGRLAERLGLLSAARHTEALQAAEALLTDIVLLAEARTRADLGSFREELSVRRRAIGPPPG